MKNSFLNFVKLILFCFFTSALLLRASNGDSSLVKIIPSENFPRWLVDGVDSAFQTSGITFINESMDSTLQFLIADDIGKIHRLFISEDTVFTITPLLFGPKVSQFLEPFPKLDFEEIFFDRYSGEVYLSIEGNGDDHLSYHGIFILEFKDGNIFQDTIVNIEKVIFNPEDEFYKNLNSNVGYEGFTADENYFYFGLENELINEKEYSTNTFIRIADKKSHNIIKEISTEKLGITSICGLYSDNNLSIWGVDRNSKKVFKLIFDEYFNVAEIEFFEYRTVIPKYSSFEYVGSLESITIAADKFLFMVDDPWHSFFIPPDEILNQLDKKTSDNFKKFIPVIYKFKLE